MSREFTVPGAPVPQGSMKAFAGRGAAEGKAFTTASNAGPLQRYRNDIRNTYNAHYHTEPRLLGAVEVFITFYFQRPKAHYNTNGVLKDSKYKDPAPLFVTKKPDIDKLCRAVLDALSDYAYNDDKQVVSINAVMRYAENNSTQLHVFELPDAT